jgi:hypothetical protein
MTTVVNFPTKELLKAVQVGLTGSRSAFALAVGRLAVQLRAAAPELAQQLSGLAGAANALRAAEPATPLPVDADSRMQLVVEQYPVQVERAPVLSDSVRVALESVLHEWDNLDILLGEGLAPARMLLFCGQPGVGKTLAAHWLAQELKLPLLTLNLATVMSSYLGKTGNNLKAVFDHATARPCVLLLDEFDAIAKRRDDDSDVGELKRLVNVLLQGLDDWPTNAMLVAATNHGELLDPAVWRRFDHVLHFDPPSVDLIGQYLEKLDLPRASISPLAALLYGQSFSTIGQLVLSARKAALLEKSSLLAVLMQRALQLRGGKVPTNKPYEGEMVLMYLEGKSRREIAAHFGKTHPTVSSVIKRYLGE